MKRLIVFLVAAIALTSYGLETYLTMENDTLIPKGKFGGGDHDYTHGTRLEAVTDDGIHFMIEQNMYAPSDLRRKDHIVGDRPYCGMLIGGVGYEFFQDPESPWTHYGELDFGMIGPSAQCEATQKFVHKVLHCKEPMGWSNQLHDEFVVNGQWWTKYNWYVTDWFAVVPRVGVAAGTIQDMVEIGCNFKLGYNIRPTVTSDIMFSSSGKKGWKDKLSAWVYAGVDERYYLYNHILEGSMFGHKDDGLDVDIERFVAEARVGAVLKYDRFFATYYIVFRQKEFKGQKNSPNYGGIGIGWTW